MYLSTGAEASAAGSLTPTGEAFIDVAVAHGMKRDDAIALDAVLTVADESISKLLAEGRIAEANEADAFVQAHIGQRFGDVFPTVAIRSGVGA